MRLLITGASGFLGRYVVAEALRRRHSVRALVHPEADAACLPRSGEAEVELIPLDLRNPDGIRDALRGVDTVIHLAAVKEGSFAAQFAGTVTTTSNLVEAMVDAHVLRLVAISSLSVLDYLRARPGTIIDEGSPLECDAFRRDAYTRTKLLQERIFRDFQLRHDGEVTILRPGVLYGRGNLWNARLGVRLRDDLWLRIGNDATLPSSYVENCAEAIVIASERPDSAGETLHIVDDDLPTQHRYSAAVRTRMKPAPRVLPVGYPLLSALARAVWWCNVRLCKGRLSLPGILVPARLHARFKPLRYSNQRAKRVLDWTPRYSLQMALDRSFGGRDALPGFGRKDPAPPDGRR